MEVVVMEGINSEDIKRVSNVKRIRRNIVTLRLPTASSEAKRHKSTCTPPLTQVMKYMVPSVLALATLKYQDNTERLFVENPIPVWCFLAATCVYWLTVGAMKQMPPGIGVKCKCYKNIVLSYAALTFGVLSAISLLSIFLPRQISLLLLGIWIPLPILLAWPILKYAFNLLGPKISNGIEKTCTKMGWVRGYKEESSLPV